MFDKKITFVFQSGRFQRLNSKEQSYSKEFFYAYHNFKKEFTTVNIIEFNDLYNHINTTNTINDISGFV